jgi:hypothetical protein
MSELSWTQMSPKDARLGHAVVRDASIMEMQRQDLRAKYVVWESFVRGELVQDLHFSLARSTGTWNPNLFNAFGGTPSLNVMGIVVETLQSMLFSLQPFITYDTSGAPNHKMRQMGRKKTNFVDAVWDETELYQHTAMSGRDASVFGTGFIKGSVPDRNSKRIVLERIHPDGSLFDMRDAAKGNPLRWIHRDFMQKEVAKFHWPKHARAIDASQTVFGFLAPNTTHNDWCSVLDAYYVDPDPQAAGLHVIVVGNEVVFGEPWKLGRLPVESFAYNKVSAGILGKGAAQDLLELQVSLDENERNIADGVRKMAHGKILVSLAADLSNQMFDDVNGTILRYAGDVPPVFISPQAMSPEVYARSESIIQRMFHRVGVTELMSQGAKPAGLDSAPAQREYADQASQRFLDLGGRYEHFHARIGDLTCALAELYDASAIDARNGVTTWSSVSGYTTGRWRAFPVSKLPRQPAARKAQIDEDFSKGLIARDDYLRLRQYPDTESWVNDEIAPRQLIEDQLDSIMDNGRYEAPNPYMDNSTAFEVAVKRHNRAQQEHESDGILGLLERYIDQAKANMENAVMQRQQMQASAQPVQALIPQAAAPPQAA